MHPPTVWPCQFLRSRDAWPDLSEGFQETFHVTPPGKRARPLRNIAKRNLVFETSFLRGEYQMQSQDDLFRSLLPSMQPCQPQPFLDTW